MEKCGVCGETCGEGKQAATELRSEEPRHNAAAGRESRKLLAPGSGLAVPAVFLKLGMER